jgi:hypothetical protein
MTRRLYFAALAAIVLAGPAILAQDRPAQPAPKNPLLKLSEPWPDDDAMAAQKAAAEQRKLFQDGPAIEFTLTSDFGAINRERKPNNGKQFPAVLTVDGRDIPVKLSSRGHLRLDPKTCAFVPIKIEFAADQIAGTIFEGQTSLKLGTHCQNEKESDQYVTREYLTYKLTNLVTPSSFRARLARATYVDAKSKKTVSTHTALFLEHENDVARRMGGRDVPLLHREFKDFDLETLTTSMLLEYMLGNTDYSIWALHNFVVIQDKRRTFYPIPYDFDMSGMVQPPYATPDPRLHLRDVTERLYRGPCRTVEQFNAAAEPFRAHKTEMLSVIDSVADLSNRHKNDMKNYLERFFKTIESPDAIKKTFVDGCHTARTRV